MTATFWLVDDYLEDFTTFFPVSTLRGSDCKYAGQRMIWMLKLACGISLLNSRVKWLDHRESASRFWPAAFFL